jgi:mRNA interferase MazF
MASVDDLWLVDFGDADRGEPASLRPALVLGPPDTFGPSFPYVFVTPLTTTHRALSLHVKVGASDTTGLDDTSYVQCELIRSVNRNRLIHRLGGIDSTVGHEVAEVVRTLLNH